MTRASLFFVLASSAIVVGTLGGVSKASPLANHQIDVTGVRAANILIALRAAGLQPAGGTEDSATYRARAVDCIQRTDPDTGSDAGTECTVNGGPSETVPAREVTGPQAEAIMKAFIAAGAQTESQMMSTDIMVERVEGTLNSGGPEAAEATFIDSNGVDPAPSL